MDKSPDAFRTISEVAEHLQTPAHVLRFWESRFPQIRPVKRAGGRRYYRPSDVALLAGIRRLLHDEGLTIRGVQKILREQGVRHVSGLTDEEMEAADAAADTIEATVETGGRVVWLGTPGTPGDAGQDTAQDLGLDMAPEAISEAELLAEDLPHERAESAEEGQAGTEAAPAGDEAEPEDEVEAWAGEAEPADAGGPEAGGDAWAASGVEQPAAGPDDIGAEPESAAGPPTPADLPPDDLPLFASRPHVPEAPGPAPEPAEAPAPADSAALAGRLRALPPGALADRAAAIAPLFDRLAGHRNTLAARARGGRA